MTRPGPHIWDPSWPISTLFKNCRRQTASEAEAALEMHGYTAVCHDGEMLRCEYASCCSLERRMQTPSLLPALVKDLLTLLHRFDKKPPNPKSPLSCFFFQQFNNIKPSVLYINSNALFFWNAKIHFLLKHPYRGLGAKRLWKIFSFCTATKNMWVLTTRERHAPHPACCIESGMGVKSALPKPADCIALTELAKANMKKAYLKQLEEKYKWRREKWRGKPHCSSCFHWAL